MAVVEFVIPGRLRGKKRAGRHYVGGNVVQSFNPPETRSAEGVVRWYAAQATRGQVPVMTGPVRVSIYAWHIPPKSWSAKKRHQTIYVTGKPDVDNQQKLIFDALNGVVWRDDAQIADVHFVRKYTETEQERVEILIEELGAAA